MYHNSSHVCVILMSINIDMILFDIQHCSDIYICHINIDIVLFDIQHGSDIYTCT